MVTKLTRIVAFVVLISIALAACAPSATPTVNAPVSEAPTQAAAAPTQAVAAAPTAIPAVASGVCKPEEIRLVNSMREIAQPYHAGLDKGGKLFTAWANLKPEQYVLQLNQGDTDKQISLMRTLLADNPKCTIFNVEPNSEVAVTSMVEVANQTGAMIVTHWDTPKGVYPYNPGNDQWAAHVSVPSFDSGYKIAKALFDKMGGKGKIVALEGLQSVMVAQQRFEGLQKALTEYPGIEMIAHQPADWDRTKAFPIMQTWLTKFPGQIAGVWAANDDMGLGALEALREAGSAGKVPVVGIDGIPEAFKAVKDGEFVVTVSSDATYQGSIGLAMGYCVLTGKTPQPKEWTKDQRMFFLTPLVIDASNVDKYLGEPNAKDYESTWKCDSLWTRSLGPSYPTD